MAQTSSEHLLKLADVLGGKRDEIVTNVVSRLEREPPTNSHESDSHEIGSAVVHTVLASACSTLAACGRVPPHAPSLAVEEAAAAARDDLPWEVLDRGYGIAHEVLADAVVVELGRWNLRRQAHTLTLQLASRCLFRCFDFLVTAAARAYDTERRSLLDQRGRQTIEMVNHVLCGISISDSELGYGTPQKHLGVVAWGDDPRLQVQRAARRLGAEVLVVPRTDGSIWAWLGRPHFCPEGHLRGAFDAGEATQVAVGSVQAGRDGFVATHDQARLASLVALRQGGRRRDRITWYADVAIESMALADESRARTFATYALAALVNSDPSSVKLRETLRVYFQAGQNTALAARELKIAERTVRYRLRVAEERIGQRVTSQEVAVAIRVFAALEDQARSWPSAMTNSIQALAS